MTVYRRLFQTLTKAVHTTLHLETQPVVQGLGSFTATKTFPLHPFFEAFHYAKHKQPKGSWALPGNGSQHFPFGEGSSPKAKSLANSTVKSSAQMPPPPFGYKGGRLYIQTSPQVVRLSWHLVNYRSPKGETVQLKSQKYLHPAYQWTIL